MRRWRRVFARIAVAASARVHRSTGDRGLENEVKLAKRSTKLAVDAAPPSNEETLERVARAGVRLVDLQFSDIGGGAKVLTIPVDILSATLEHGYRFDGAALTGGLRKIELDLYLV